MSVSPTRFDSLHLGQSAEVTKHVTDAVVRAFAEVSGDFNPVHLDDAYAATTIFKQRIAHGMISGAYLSALIANELPGPGSIYLGSTMSFKAPVPVGDSVTVRVEVKELRPEKKICILACTVRRTDGTVVVEGDSTIKLLV